MRFWDSSAIVPLLVMESQRERALSLLERDTVMLVWWATPVELCSAIARHERSGDLSVGDAASVLERLEALALSWHELQPTARLRRTAQRLLRVHPLRSADALQLAAAMTASGGEVPSLEFVSLDDRLNEAARREGFRVLE